MLKSSLLLAAGALALSGCDTPGGNTAAAAPAGGNAVSAVSPAGTDWTTTVTETPEGGMRMGNPDAQVKVVEFASMTCPHCRDFSAQSSEGVRDLVKTGKVSFEFRNFVMNQIDVVQSLLARCGGPQPFFTLTEQMFAEQDATMQKIQAGAAQLQAAESLPGSQTFVKVAEVAGLDKFVGMRGIPAAKGNACLTNEAELKKLVAMNQAAVNEHKVTATPSFLINGKLIDAPPLGTEVWADLEPQIRAAMGA